MRSMSHHFGSAFAVPPLVATADEDAIIKWRAPALGANLVPKLPQACRNNGDESHRFFESFVPVSLGWCSLVIT